MFKANSDPRNHAAARNCGPCLQPPRKFFAALPRPFPGQLAFLQWAFSLLEKFFLSVECLLRRFTEKIIFSQFLNTNGIRKDRLLKLKVLSFPTFSLSRFFCARIVLLINLYLKKKCLNFPTIKTYKHGKDSNFIAILKCHPIWIKI